MINDTNKPYDGEVPVQETPVTDFLAEIVDGLGGRVRAYEHILVTTENSPEIPGRPNEQYMVKFPITLVTEKTQTVPRDSQI